jgi:hypothetical protein
MNNSLLELQKQQLRLEINRQPGSVVTPTISQLPTTAPDVETPNQGFIDNQIDNSDFSWSKDSYTNSTPAGGDIAQECYNFFRHRLIRITDLSTTNGSPTVNSATGPFKSAYTYPMSFIAYGTGGSAGETLTGTLTRVSDTQATLSTNALATLTDGVLWFGDTLTEAAATAIKASSHSLFAANEGTDLSIPRWDRVNGWVEIGSDDEERWSLDAPFAQNVIRPGLPMFAIAIVKLRDTVAAMSDGAKCFFGCWDATSARNRWIEGDNFDLSVTPVGTTGATSVSYKAIGILSDGSQIESDVVTITNSNATLSASNYNRLTWTNAPGILDFTLYRLMAGAYHRVFTITNGASDFNDTGGFEAVVAGFPTTNLTRAIAYKETGTIFPPDYDSGWIAIGVAFTIPSTYDVANTTGRQWFRAGIVEETTDNRSVLLDRLGLSTLQGAWTISSRDRNLIQSRFPDSTPGGSDQGGTGIDTCFETLTLVARGAIDGDELRATPIGKIEQGDYCWDGSRGMRRVKKVKKATVAGLWLVVLENGAWFRATQGERFITSRADKDGTLLRDLMMGDTIICPSESGHVEQSKIIAINPIEGQFEVVTLEFFDGHIFAVGNMTDKGILWGLAHNRKIDLGNQS